MKSYTDLEQSKRLSEILPIESADMCYRIVAYNPNDTHEYQPYCFVGTLESDIPCWSLSALLDVMQEPELIKNSNGTWLIRVWYNRYPWSRGGYNNPVDACYEMILKLRKQKLL
jgi:hypothetical protein